MTVIGAAWLAASLAVGCSNETGVLVEVTRDSSTTPEDIETLEFVIGLTSAEYPDTFLVDSSSISEVSVRGRDLKTSPFHLLVREGDRSGAKLTVAVLARKGTDVVGFAGFDEPQAFIGGQVLMRRVSVKNDSSASLTDSGCVIWFDAHENRHEIASQNDQDCDGDLADVDCNDHDPTIGPSRTEICGNGIDDNCRDLIDEVTDDDMDTFTNCAGDCDDNDGDVHPGADEICDGKDNDCNALCDDGATLDFDQDRFNLCGEKIRVTDGACEDIGVPDCDDHDGAVHPGAVEICNGKDDDCDGTCDVSDGVIDLDGDGVTDCGTIPGPTCIGPQSGLIDCRDDDPDVHPGAAEICDGKDDNCDTVREQHEACYSDTSGTCRLGSRNCDDDGSDGTTGLFDCMTSDGSPAVADGFCSAYQTCEAMSPPPDDLFACANASQSFANQKLACTLSFKPDLSLCPELRTPLDFGTSGTTCRWQLLAGQIQAHYVVGLFDGVGGGAQASLNLCDGEFGVLAKRDFVPRRDSIYLDYVDESNVRKAFEISITPTLVALCPQSGLSCVTMSP